MAAKTGNTRTLTLTATFAGIQELSTLDAPYSGFDTPPATPDANASYTFSLSDCSIAISQYNATKGIGGGAIPTGSKPTSYDLGVTVTVRAGMNSASANFSENHLNNGPSDVVLNMSYTISGSVTFVFELQEYIETGGLTGPNPWYDAVPDAPAYTTGRVWERVVSCSVSSTVGGNLAVSEVRTSPLDMDYTAHGQVSVHTEQGAGSTWSITPDTIDNPAWTGSGVTTARGSGSISGWASLTLQSAYATVVEGSVFTAVSYNKDVGIVAAVQAMDGPYPTPLSAIVSGIPGTTASTFTGQFSASGVQKVNSGSATIDGVVITATTVNTFGPVAASLTGASLTAAGEDWVNTDLANFPNPAPERFSDAEWLRPRLTRMMSRGKTFGAIQLSLASTYGTPAGTTWGNAASVTNTFNPEWSSGSYPFMRVVVTGHGGTSIAGTISIPPCSVALVTDPTVGSVETEVYSGSETPTKIWAFTTSASDNTAQTVEIPLYAPDNIATSPDTQDSDWPWPVRRPIYSGVYRIPSLTIALDAPTSGQTVEVVSVELFRSDHPAQVTYLPTYFHSIFSHATIFREAELYREWPLKSGPDTMTGDTDFGTTFKHYTRRGMVAFQDGMQSLEESDFGYTRSEPFSGTPIIFTFNLPSIQALCDKINGKSRQLTAGGTLAGMIDSHPGWVATPSVPVPAFTPGAYPNEIPPASGYYNAGLPATYLGGAGMMRVNHGGTYRFDPIFDIPGDTTGQPLYDTLEWHPNWKGFEYTGTAGTGEGAKAFIGAVLRAEGHGQVLRSRAHPIILDTLDGHKRPAPDVSVTLTQVDARPDGANVNASAGSGNTDRDGFYHTGAPGGRAGSVSHAVGLTGNAQAAANAIFGKDVWWARHRRRATFSLVLPSGGNSPWIYCRNDGSIFLVFLDGDKAVNLWRARHVPRSDADWEIKVLALAGAVWAAPRITGDPSHRLRIVATRADGSGVYTCTSDDDGATWTGAA